MAPAITVKGIGPVPPVRPFTSFDEYAKLANRVAELEERRSKLLKQADAVQQAIASAPGRERERLASLLTADSLPDSLDAFDANAMRSEYSRLAAEAGLVGKAIDEGKSQLVMLRRRLAPQALADVNRWHRQLVARMAQAGAELLRLARLEAQAVESLDDAGIAADALGANGPAAPGPFTGLGGADGAGAPWLRELAAAGYVSLDDPAFTGTGVGAADERQAEARRAAANARLAEVERQHAKQPAGLLSRAAAAMGLDSLEG